MAYNSFVVLWIIVCAFFIHIILHSFTPRIFKHSFKLKESSRKKSSASPVFKRLLYVLQGLIVKVQAQLWLDDSHTSLRTVIDTASNIWILFFILLTIYALLDHLQTWVLNKNKVTQFPIRGLLQTIKLVAGVVFILIAVSILLDKSPLILLSGLGALSAVLMLVFRDPILGLVAGIQLSANDMLAIGDWLEMPKYGADGNVIDIGLTTVKVQNWDKTITTIPTYALISDSFKNWRGMSLSGGRRIKRNILIDLNSIKFLSKNEIDKLKGISLLTEYLTNKEFDINQQNAANPKVSNNHINGRQLTNIGTFRAYLVAYLQSHPDIHQEMTLLVRQLGSSSHGLPIEIYAFTNTVSWAKYESIQSDIFDHIFAILKEFQLRAHTEPTGNDIRLGLGLKE